MHLAKGVYRRARPYIKAYGPAAVDFGAQQLVAWGKSHVPRVGLAREMFGDMVKPFVNYGKYRIKRAIKGLGLRRRYRRRMRR